MNEVTIPLWGRVFSMRVEFDHYDDDVIPAKMESALDTFLDHLQDVQNSQDKLKEYCIKQDADELVKLFGKAEIEDVFDVVMPDCLFVLRPEGHRRIALMLDYRFDIDEGLALLFVDEKLKSIGTQSSVF